VKQSLAWVYHKRKCSLKSGKICCPYLRLVSKSGMPSDKFLHRGLFRQLAEDQMLRLETRKLDIKKLVKKGFSLIHGILYSFSRLPTRIQQIDLDINLDSCFYDSKAQFKRWLPLITAESVFFNEYLKHVHDNIVSHAGLSVVRSFVKRHYFLLGSPDKLIDKYCEDCVICIGKRKKTLEVAMSDLPSERVAIVPPYTFIQIDIVYGFQAHPFLNARKRIPMYGLLLVCNVTGHSSMYALEAISLDIVAMTLHRHYGRYGVARVLLVDNGSQLVALAKTEVPVLNLMRNLQSRMRVRVSVSTPKAHNERGRVEIKVRRFRKVLEDWIHSFQGTTGSSDFIQTPLMWESTFAYIMNTVNSLPMGRFQHSNQSDYLWDSISPNRLSIGQNLNTVLDGPISLVESSIPAKILEKNKTISESWYKIFISRLFYLSARPKWHGKSKVRIDDVVLFRYTDCDKTGWKIGRVVEILKKGELLLSYSCQPVLSKSKIQILHSSRLNYLPQDARRHSPG